MDPNIFGHPLEKTPLSAFGCHCDRLRTPPERCCVQEKFKLPRVRWQSSLWVVPFKISKTYPTPFVSDQNNRYFKEGGTTDLTDEHR